MDDYQILLKKARSLDINEVLAKEGLKGKRQGNNVWYHSPFHKDKTPSLSVHIDGYKWFDWGSGEGGDIIKLGMKLYSCTEETFVRRLQSDFKNQMLLNTNIQAPRKTKSDPDLKIEVSKVRYLSSQALLYYLKDRHIPPAIATAYCKEVVYKYKDREYYSIGFQNDSGGWALRNRLMKQATIPNDSTFIDNGSKNLAVFEGFFDFLSYKTLYHGQDVPSRNYLILNTTSFFKKKLPLMQKHDRVHLYMDTDDTANKLIKMVQDLNKEQFIDERGLYKGYKDLNDFHTKFGHLPKNQLNQKM